VLGLVAVVAGVGVMDTEVTFKAMADGTRRRILQLVMRQELSVSELVACLNQPQSTVSRHLKVLRDAGLVQDRRDGTTVLIGVVETGDGGGWANGWNAAKTGSGQQTGRGKTGDVGGRGNGVANGNGNEGGNGNGGGLGSLQIRLMDWLADESFPRSLTRRLERVLREREGQSSGFFSRIGQRWDQLRSDAFGGVFHVEALTALLPREWVVADIGTGTGYLLPVLSRSFRKVVAVEPVAEMIEVARRRCEVRKLSNVVIKQGDLKRLPISGGRVNLAVAMLVLHHVPDPAEAMSELFRIVGPGGRLLIVEQRAHGLADFHERMQDRWWGFEPGALKRQVSKAGFVDVVHRRLPAESDGSVGEVPELFVMTACKPM
jgi:ubiquinone/menaquinone biosynthesis C-methylase UbiE/DNA-binding transcriptional ArsR family regulator